MEVIIKLDKLLKEKNMSQREFAKITGIRHPTISAMCNNTAQQIPIKNIKSICKVLEIDDLNELITIEKDSQN
ncbi:helix-turn-helix transcriptional regulator [Schinkia azotoformans]|uniref:helix-turn-helix domain-containing protein n=1 Tax=Schinkia azotoformans TaxID=1454 RepID=UPI002DBE136E|nr:helix-turn-helix transcriptional regulator [Schinkia azotoformans]MEC1778385.1 helix-turn-helix transcriptional regulator [Schinkia azotoformans]MED4328370.1 helix-turn-helix transcriptional regulator [Schinkia azotoformans]